jgi:hypothetical protein
LTLILFAQHINHGNTEAVALYLDIHDAVEGLVIDTKSAEKVVCDDLSALELRQGGVSITYEFKDSALTRNGKTVMRNVTYGSFSALTDRGFRIYFTLEIDPEPFDLTLHI